jgi:hypothetical protein
MWAARYARFGEGLILPDLARIKFVSSDEEDYKSMSVAERITGQLADVYYARRTINLTEILKASGLPV